MSNLPVVKILSMIKILKEMKNNIFFPDADPWWTVCLAMVGKFQIAASFAVIYVYAGELMPTVVRSQVKMCKFVTILKVSHFLDSEFFECFEQKFKKFLIYISIFKMVSTFYSTRH